MRKALALPLVALLALGVVFGSAVAQAASLDNKGTDSSLGSYEMHAAVPIRLMSNCTLPAK